jgi:signal transduction histidine kinase
VAVPGDTEIFGRILLVETEPSALRPPNQTRSSGSLGFDIGHDLRQACQIMKAGLHQLVIAGPRLDALSLDGVGAVIGGSALQLDSLFSKLPALYQAQDAKQLLVRVVETAANALGQQQIFALLCDRVSGGPDLTSLCMTETCPPDLAETLARYLDPPGTLEDIAGALPPKSSGAGMGPWLWMVPLTHSSRIEALLGVALWEPADKSDARALGMLRLFALVSAPFLAALRDMEPLRRRTEELENVLQIKSHVMSNVCHDFRSLLAAVRGYSKRLLDGRTGTLNDLQRDQLTVVLRNTNKLLDLVSHSLPFVAEQDLRVESFDLREVWQGALKQMRRHISEKSIRIREEIRSENFTVTADRGRIAVIFELVLASAIHCSAPEAELTTKFLRGANGEVTVRLFAPGAGLPPHILERLFDHSGESMPLALHPDAPGIPGLAFVHDMILAHGGRIAVTSDGEEGTIFVFTLPPPQKL